MDCRHIYDLSFVSPESSKEINPHIVFSMSKRHLEVFQTKLRFIITRVNENKIAEEYLGVHSEFTPLDKDIFGNYTFGYGRCGYMNVDDEGEAHFYFELRDGVRTHYTSMTIWVLLKVLNYMLVAEEIEPSNRWQFIQIDTACRHEMHGHSMSGWVSTDLGVWLKKQGKKVPEHEISMFANISLPDVEEVMFQTWNTITRNEFKEKGNEFQAVITPDGRFALICPGNACDVSIYHDQLYGDEIGTQSVQFSCHNLDGAVQQITLLAGIAKLCELARNDK